MHVRMYIHTTHRHVGVYKRICSMNGHIDVHPLPTANRMTACFALRPKTYTGRHSGRTLRVTECVAVQSVRQPFVRRSRARGIVGGENFPCSREPRWFRLRSWPSPARRTCSPSVRAPRKCSGRGHKGFSITVPKRH